MEARVMVMNTAIAVVFIAYPLGVEDVRTPLKGSGPSYLQGHTKAMPRCPCFKAAYLGLCPGEYQRSSD